MQLDYDLEKDMADFELRLLNERKYLLYTRYLSMCIAHEKKKDETKCSVGRRPNSRL